tara:strand:- start:3072 stop:3353 length:282 start_codon:yes stop_codon:yes gene_type:complete
VGSIPTASTIILIVTICIESFMFSPSSLVGKEVQALDDKEYGHRVLSYDSTTNSYIVETIYWSNGELVNPDYLGSTISSDDLYSKYDVKFLVQ